MERKKKSVKRGKMAAFADRHVCYEQSVQNTEVEFEFVDRVFKRIRGRKAYSMREDFCGTASMCVEWVKRRPKNIAIGVDLDEEVLRWAWEHNIEKLRASQRSRVTLLRKNVLSIKTDPVDLLLAMNFSYQIFKDRKTLRSYFKNVLKGLNEEGVFILDVFGGYDAFRELKEKTVHEGFTYIWEQARYNPINGDIVCHIHFLFPDRSKIEKAFTYEWRLWTLPELQELLIEAGFKNITVYWQGTDEETGEGNGVFEPATVGDADPGWISFISAEK